ncbi:MAG TPA: serine hydrolase domain-containing protein [Bryobacteraceae bacterium]|nr:serine hydrolase domain-containing protein [Bryobacteraceae bacterium]
MRRFLGIAVLCCLAALAAPPDSKKAGMDPERLARIPVRMKQFVDQGSISGAVTLVARHGVLAELDAVGYQDVEKKTPMRPDSIFQIMSMTKPVVAVGIMILMEEGRLAPSDLVEKHLPEFRGQWMIESSDPNTRSLKRPSRPITIRDLLTHTSGMPSMPPEGLKELYSDMKTPLAEAVSVYSQMPLEFEPGSKWQYSNPGIAILGRIIEVAADQPFEKFCDERIFKPLGMKDSFFFPTPDKLERIALVYRLDENKKLRKAGRDTLGGDPWEYRKGARYPAPEFGLYSTAQDLWALYQMVLNGGTYNGKRFLSKPTVEMMTTLHTGDLAAGHEPGRGYGLAWTVVKDPIGGLQLQSIGTYGHGGAFGTQGTVDPKKDLITVFMIQRSAGGDSSERNAFLTMAASAIVE